MSQRYFSNIYWHFTGSPKNVDWSLARCPKDIIKQGPVLDDSEAANTLCLIIESSILRATCTEKIFEENKTDPFCCVTDIPLKDLPSHSPYYGKVAIGFKAEAIHQRFVPVLYIPEQNLPAIEKMVPNQQLVGLANNFLGNSGGFQEQQGMKLLGLASRNKVPVKKVDTAAIGGFYSNYVKITNFDSDPENSYYREREWRGIGDFNFTHSDIEAVVAPSSVLKKIRETLQQLGINDVNVISWEFIEQA